MADEGSISTPTGEERAAIFAAVHEQFLDAEVAWQPNEVVANRLLAGEGYAFLVGTVQVEGGGDIDWSITRYQELIDEGLFDGPTLTVLLADEEGDWYVLEGAIGATDAWWWGSWQRHVDLPCGVFGFIEGDGAYTQCMDERVYTVAAEDEVALSIGAVLQASVIAQDFLHPEAVALEQGTLRAAGTHAFFMGDVVATDGEIDWSQSVYAEDAADGLMDGGHTEALLQRDDQGVWSVLEYGIGSTDVWWSDLPSEYPDAACALFGEGACQSAIE